MPRAECGFRDDEQGSGRDWLVSVGPTLWMDAGFDSAYTAAPGQVPTPGMRNIPALVDTGALESCIDDSLATELNLPVVDRVNMSGVGGLHVAKVYLAQIRSPRLHFVQYGRFTGAALTEGGQSHKILIGRTFLMNSIMFYDGQTGAVTLVK